MTDREAIAWYDPSNGAVSTDKNSASFTPLGQVVPLYDCAQQRTWVGLTPDEKYELSWQQDDTWDVCEATEAKLKEKNFIAPQVSAGPITPEMQVGPTPEQKAQIVDAMQAPQQRTWVGLTDEEAVALMKQTPHLTVGGLLAVGNKLKEKNT